MRRAIRHKARSAVACAIVVSIAAWHAAGEKRSVAAEGDAVLVGAGDIADCVDLSGAEATEKVLAKIPGTVMAIGDLAYPDGSAANFACYDKTWGKERSRTRPAPGNHEFHSAGATYYFQYFGAAAGEASKGYYSYELGSWHIVVLNSECEQVGGCGAGSARSAARGRPRRPGGGAAPRRRRSAMPRRRRAPAASRTTGGIPLRPRRPHSVRDSPAWTRR